MNALTMGSDALIQGANNFTIGEKLTVGYPLNQSQISNSGTINSDILLADTGYGQGEIMVTTLNVEPGEYKLAKRFFSSSYLISSRYCWSLFVI